MSWKNLPKPSAPKTGNGFHLYGPAAKPVASGTAKTPVLDAVKSKPGPVTKTAPPPTSTVTKVTQPNGSKSGISTASTTHKAGTGAYSTAYEPCYSTHPPYEIAPGLTIYGGSCNTPKVTDMDVAIGFDHGMQQTSRAWPWTQGTEVYFPITDRAAPASAANFKKLVEWTAEQLKAGKKVHCGCIGGHGRTGTFLAALRMHLTGDVKAIEHVRKNYCAKAVESAVQVAFLEKEWGVAHADPTDNHMHGGYGAYGGYSGYSPGKYTGASATHLSSDASRVTYLRQSSGGIWR